jgi:precorrin-3B synthase
MTIVDLRRGWCPSLLRPMESGDGWLVRVRPRAAVITAAVARAVAEGASRYGNGRIEITNRANLQVRGLRPETIDLFVAAMEAVGAADDGPAILVSPLAGADPGVAAETVAISGLVARALVARAYPSRRPDGVAAPQPVDSRHAAAHDDAKSGLPPKFGFLIDGGGVLPLTGLSLDITLHAVDGNWQLNGENVQPEDAPSRAVALAQELAQAPRHVPGRTAAPPALGFHPYGDGGEGAVLLAPPFGQLQAAQLAALAALAERWGDGALRPTPWKSLAIAGVARGDEAFLRDQAHQISIISDPADRRLGIVTCVGAPACRRGEVNTQATAATLATLRRDGEPLLHLSGCAKGCAHPGRAEVTLVGQEGRFAFIRDGRPSDEPVALGLTLAQCIGLLQSVPA